MKSFEYNRLEPEFQFAGINFPKWVWGLHRGPWKKRLERRRNSCTSWGYCHAPRPLESRDETLFFYLDSDGMPDLRWTWCDAVSSVSINHTGWYCDDYYDQKIRGIVLRLPRSRGFLAGWSRGEGMASNVDYHVFETEQEAALCADSMAENAAEREKEYQAQMQAEQDELEVKIANRFTEAMACGL